MRWVRFSLAVVGTSLVLIGVIGLIAGYTVGNAFASATSNAVRHSFDSGNLSGNLPPELSGLKDIPVGERFEHFKGVQANLTDKDGKPLLVTVTPGVASNVSSTSVTLNGNDGATHTYTIDPRTMTPGQPASGQDVVVVTLNNASDATAVFAVTPGGGAWHGGPPWAQH